MNNRKTVVFIISIFSIGLLIYLPNNIHFKALCGDVDAQFQIGSELINSKSKIDQEQGVELLTRAGAKGNVDAIYLVGWMQIYGEEIQHNNIDGFKCLMRAYELKSKMSSGYRQRLFYFLGLCYLDGIGTIKDIDKAIEFLTESAKNGEILAHHGLAVAYGFLAAGLYEKASKEEKLSSFCNRSFYTEKDKEAFLTKQSFAIKAWAHWMLYAQENKDISLLETIFNKSLSNPHKDRSVSYFSMINNADWQVKYAIVEALKIEPESYKIAEKYAKETQQSINSD